MNTFAAQQRSGVVGRETELDAVGAFLSSRGSPSALVLTGGAGIGKTTLWEAGIGAARAQGCRVLLARSSGAEAQLSFGGLIDLLDGVDVAALAGLPPPQRSALEVALLRSPPASAAPEPHAIGLGLLNVLRELSADRPVVVAVDDVQWLDAPSADALAFAARRLQDEPVRLLLARRDGLASPLEGELRRGELQRVEVGPLSLGATRRVLAARLDLSVSRQLLRRIVEVTLGNPLFVLELGHTLIQMGVPEIGEDMPVPGGVEEILGTRVASLTPPLRRLLIAVALTANPRTAELAALEGSKALDDAVDAGLLVVVRDRVRASHPLIAAAAKSNAPRAQVRALHVALAKVLSDPELRAMHMALAADRPQADLADTVAQAASRATARGAREQALALAEHALRLTPPDAAVRSERVLRLAGYLETAGEMQRMTDLLTAELEHVPAGLPRARAWLMLSEGTGPRSLEDIQSYRAYALAECPEDPGLRAVVLAKRACNDAASAVMRIGEAETCALEAVSHARRAGSAVERTALYALAWARAMAGRPVDDLCEAARTADDSAAYIAASPERVAGQRLVWRGEIDLARATLTHFLALADERGERESYALQRLHMCELSLRVGDFDDAQALLDEWAESSDRALMFRPKYERCRALLAAGRGAVDEARRWGEVALERSVSTGSRWDGLETLRALGIAALLEHKPDLAVASLREVWDHTEREGVQDPGVFPVAPELIEALAELGELEPARSVSARLRELAEREDHPWGRLTADRCDGLTALAGERYDPAAADTLERAAVGYAQRGLRLDAARALLSLGRAQRRLKQWGGARRSLEQAAALFEQMAAPGWAAQAQSQIARVGARRPKASGELTATERRTAELAASGLSNKEIAEQLVVTVHTVEVHLSRAYAKLGIRSRGQLSGRLFG